MPLQHLQSFPVFQADDVVREHRFPDRYRRLGLFDRGGGRIANIARVS